MNNMEKWFKTMEYLQEVEVAPFNPNFSQEGYNKALLHKKVMQKARRILVNIPNKYLTEDQKDILEDRLFVISCSVLGLYSYYLDSYNCPWHNTKKGQDLICEVGLFNVPLNKNMKQTLEKFVS